MDESNQRLRYPARAIMQDYFYTVLGLAFTLAPLALVTPLPAVTGVLADEPEPGWKGVLDQALLEGFPFANEVVSFHRPSATLIASDLAFNIGSGQDSKPENSFQETS